MIAAIMISMIVPGVRRLIVNRSVAMGVRLVRGMVWCHEEKVRRENTEGP